MKENQGTRINTFYIYDHFVGFLEIIASYSLDQVAQKIIENNRPRLAKGKPCYKIIPTRSISTRFQLDINWNFVYRYETATYFIDQK